MAIASISPSKSIDTANIENNMICNKNNRKIIAVKTIASLKRLHVLSSDDLNVILKLPYGQGFVKVIRNPLISEGCMHPDNTATA